MMNKGYGEIEGWMVMSKKACKHLVEGEAFSSNI